MNYTALARRLPGRLRRSILHFEAVIEREVRQFAASLPAAARVLDAGAGEARHAAAFRHCRYTAFDLAVGDAAWDYSQLDAVGDLAALPFASAAFDAALNVVTLEHVPDPAAVLAELARVLRPGARLLLIAPHEWEVHQAPHDYYRYTRHGLEHLLAQAGLRAARIEPVGGFFRLLSRRLFNALQFFPLWLWPLAALFIAPPALLLPLLDPLDRERRFTLGYSCIASKP